MRLLRICLVLLISFPAFSSGMKSFSTDFCTSYPEGPISAPWLWADCCLEHDLYYWAGGERKYADEADLRLKKCVEDKGEPFQANLMYLGIRLGKKSPIKFKTQKWGNAWGVQRSYEALTLEEIEAIDNLIKDDQTIPQDMLKVFLHNIYSRLN